MTIETVYMQRCLKLAQRGFGQVAPNPMVGCVIVHNGHIIGEGYHMTYGKAHAEVNAIASVKDKSLLSKSVMYVSLEPCSHYGKTPPCTTVISKYKIPTVYVACKDTFSEVSGKGIAQLMANGVDVKTGLLEKEARFLNRRFFTFHERQRPYIILKWAQTTDGFIDIPASQKSNKSPTWITEPESRAIVHKWRSEEDAICAGAQTVLADNPTLTTRDWAGKNPLRITFDRDLSLPLHLNIFNSDAETLILNYKTDKSDGHIKYMRLNSKKNFVANICEILYKIQIQSIIIEGGTKLINTFINAGLWDEARVFTGQVKFESGIRGPSLGLLPSDTIALGKDVLKIYYNANSRY